jgi:myo-inositol-1(or 4)-monophosphatase
MGMCHVAAGFSDAMIEIANGFALWDLFPGQYILQASGGVITSLDGEVLPLDLRLHTTTDLRRAMEKRQRFVAAGNPTLHAEIMKCLSGSSSQPHL